MAYPRIIVQASEVTDHILVIVANCVEDRFASAPMPTDEGWDIEDLNTPAVRKIMRHAHYVQRALA